MWTASDLVCSMMICSLIAVRSYSFKVVINAHLHTYS